MIALQMVLYADQHKHLPPAAVYSPQGKPLLSWRVLMLPYLEQRDLYAEFHLDEPWDSKHNATLLPKMPSIFDSNPQRATRTPHTTSFRVFVGLGAAFEGPKGILLTDFADGLERTILIVEAGEPVPWTKPAELAYAPEASLPQLGSRIPDKFCAVCADCTFLALPRNLSDDELRAAITRKGGEKVAQLARFEQ